MFPRGKFEYQFETLNSTEKFEREYENLGAQKNFAEFHECFQTKYKASSLSETKDFQKDELKQAAVVLQSLRETNYSMEK